MNVLSFRIWRFTFGLFPYWIGVSRRSLGATQVIDLGFLKVMWKE